MLAASRTACVEAFGACHSPTPTPGRAACELIDGAVDDAALARAAAVIRRLPLAAWQRAELRERYAAPPTGGLGA